MPPKKRQSVIKDDSFDCSVDFSVNDCKRISVKNWSGVADALHESFNGDPVVICGLKLSADNHNITDSATILDGSIFRNEAKTFSTAKLWPFGDGLTLKIGKIECSKFVFKYGLTSELLDHSLIDYSLVRQNGSTVSLEDLNTMGFTGFCCRVFIQPVSVSKAKLTVLLFPLPAEQLTSDHPLAKDPGFPGIAIHRQEIDLGLKAAAIFDKRMGSPIVPAILPGSPLKTGQSIPKGADILAKMSAVLRCVTVPECKSNYNGLAERWEAITTGGKASLKLKQPDVLWPEASAVDAQSGKNEVFIGSSKLVI